MHENPGEMEDWRLRTQWLVKGFLPVSKQTRLQFQELSSFLNGDSRRPEFIHWCTGCCLNDDEALQKVIQLALPVFTKGYPCPLLYRFKHYEGASSFIRTGCCFFQLLPRVLKQMQANMSNKVDSSSKLTSLVESVLQDNSGGHIDAGVTDFQAALDDLLENDLSYSLQNSIRRQKVMEQVSKPQFSQSAIMIDVIINAFEYGSNMLFKRTSILTLLSAFGKQHAKFEEMAGQSCEYFLHIASGTFGEVLMGRAMNLLEVGLAEIVAMGFEPSPERMDLFFRLIIACVSDIWRRLVLEFSSFPFKWFDLLKPGASMDTFSKLWETANAAKQQKCSCVDLEFSIPLMDDILMASQDPSQDQNVLQEVQGVLRHIASFTPVTADSVEVKHGQMQWAVAKRGSQFVKHGKAAVESALINNIVKNHCIVRDEVSKATLPSGRSLAATQRQLGIASKNQHSDKVVGVQDDGMEAG